MIVAADVVDSWRLIPFERHWHSPVLGIDLLREDAAVPPGGGGQVVSRGLRVHPRERILCLHVDVHLRQGQQKSVAVGLEEDGY